MPLFPKPGASAFSGQNEHDPAPYVQKCMQASIRRLSEDVWSEGRKEVGTKEGRSPSYPCISQRDKAYTQRLDSQPPAMCMCECVAQYRVNAYAQRIQLFVCTDLCPSLPPAPTRMHVHIHMWARICPCSHLTRSGIGVQRRPLRIGGANHWSANDQAGIRSSRGHCQSPARTHTYGTCLHMCRRRILCKPSLPDRAIFSQLGTSCMVFPQGMCS